MAMQKNPGATKNLFCLAPFKGLFIAPNGNVKPCCAGKTPLGNLNQDTLDDIIKGPQFQQLRWQMLNDQYQEYCSYCIEAEKISESERHWHNSTSCDQDLTVLDETYHNAAITDIRWTNVCNLACAYCDDYFSSKWEVLLGKKPQTKPKSYFDSVVEYMKQHGQSVKTLALIGGEPLIIVQNSDIIAQVSDSTQINVITNLSVDLSKSPVFAALKSKKVHWSVSFENVFQRFEYVRYGASWETLVNNLEIIQSIPNHSVNIHAVYNIFSAVSLSEFVQFCLDRKLNIHWQNLSEPRALDIKNFPKQVKSLAFKEILEINRNPKVCSKVKDFLKNCAAELSKDYNCLDQVDLFKKTISDLDQKYHNSQHKKFADLWPELNLLLFKENLS